MQLSNREIQCAPLPIIGPLNLRMKALENEMFTDIPFSDLEFVRY